MQGRRLAFEDDRKRVGTRCAAQLYTLALKKKKKKMMMTECVFAASVGVSIEPFCACILLYVLLCYAGGTYHPSWFSAQRKCQKS